jgi:hypothetical protein
MTQVRSDSDFGVKSAAILVNRSSRRHHNTGQQRLYEFCYLFPFDLWTSYLVRILFLQGCGSWFWEFPSSTRIFNALQYNLQVWQGFINVVAGGVSRRDVVWRQWRLSVVPCCEVWCVWKVFLDLIIKLLLRFRSRYLVLWSLGPMVCESLSKGLVVQGEDASPPVHPT